MSSGTPYDPSAANDIFSATDNQFMQRNARMGMSPRQQELNRLWAYYRCVQYDSRKVDWDGSARSTHLEHEAIATAGFIPPGFYDAGGSLLPLKYRRPATPYALAKIIVDRFTGLLFSERRHPQIRVEGDDTTEDYVQALIDQARLWPTMMQARTYGGAMGSVAVGFSFVEGKPIIEVYDPRWCAPVFTDRATRKLKAIEIRYQYPVTQQDPETGLWMEMPFWYRRIINKTHDVVFQPVPVGDGAEPRWSIETSSEHGFGFCPVVWCQNLPVLDDIDGDCDFQGTTDLMNAIDTLLSQANRGTVSNCDPTVILSTDAEFDSVKKGSDNAITMPAGSSAHYLEINGSSSKTALELADQFRKYALEIAQCVIDQDSTKNVMRTATEIQRSHAAMLAKADILREQYGERLVKPLVEMMLKAAQLLNEPRQSEDGQIVRQALVLPPRVVERSDGVVEYAAQELGKGGILALQWPDYFEPTYVDAKEAAQAVSTARGAGVLDDETAVHYLAPFFRVDNPSEMLRRIRKAMEEQTGKLDESLFSSLKGKFNVAEEDDKDTE